MSKTLRSLAAGGLAGAVARTTVAPIDRVKILMQTQHVTFKGQAQYHGIKQTLKKIMQEEGVTRLWRGNVTNIVRVMPYSATQFTSYDFFKRRILPADRKDLTVHHSHTWRAHRHSASRLTGA